jgi:GT2 family glycosyltransferase
MLLDIIIVNWNSGKLLSECVESVIHSRPADLGYRILVLDNASADNSLEMLPESEKIGVIRINENLGFGAACNIGFKNSDSEYILLLNPDTLVEPDVLSDSLTFMQNQPDISVMGIQLHDRNDKVAHSCSRLPVARRYLWEILGLSKFFPRVFIPPTIMRDWNHLTSRYVDHVIGAYMLIRRSMLEEIDYFDERFFMYLEDLDLSNRAQQHGFKIFYNAEINALHEGGGISGQVKSKRLFYSLQSRLKYCSKYFSRTDFIFVLFLTLFIEPFTRIIPLLCTLRFKDAGNTFRAYSYLYRNYF